MLSADYRESINIDNINNIDVLNPAQVWRLNHFFDWISRFDEKPSLVN